MEKFDLLVIGTGPSGSRIARKCAAAGWEVGVAETQQVGGVCALRGCNPKKVFVHAAELVDWAKRSDGKLVRSSGVEIDWQALVDFTRTFTESVPNKVEKSFNKAGISVFNGCPQFISDRRLRINETEIEAEKILIATGGKPASLKIPGEDLITHSDQFFTLEKLPPRVVFIGGGYISFEFAHLTVRAGASTTILEAASNVLEPFESSLVNQLVEHSRNIGIDVKANARVVGIVSQEIPKGGTELKIEFECEGESTTIDADMVVHGGGRVPSLDGLQLENGNVDFDEQSGIAVDQFMRSTSNSRVFATGDCAASDKPRLTPVANQQAFAVTRTLLGDEAAAEEQPDYGPIASAVFTVPPLASVGMTEEQAKQEGRNYEVREGDMSKWGEVSKIGLDSSGYKIIIDADNERILGAHVFAPNAAEIIDVFTLAVKFDITARQLKSVLFTYPSSTAGIRKMV